MVEVKVGDWVVDIHGDYCKVTRIGYKSRDNGEDNAVWGFWSDNKSEELYTSPEYISLVFKLKREAKVMADIIKSVGGFEDDDYM